MIGAESALSRPLAEADLDRLEALLASPNLVDHAMRPDVLQGLFAAIVSSPVMILPSQWHRCAFGDAPAWESAAQFKEVIELAMRLHNEVAVLLLEGHGIEPILYPTGPEPDAPLDYAAWCAGYITGMELSEPPWTEFADDDAELATMLTPFFALALEDEEPDPDDPGPFDELSATERTELAEISRERLPEAVQDLYDYFIDRRQKLEPVRRAAAKVGRNDPCPCGSGKKYKLCCGAG